MRISYIIEVDPFVNSGIIKKINNQVAIWESDGHHVQKLILWPGASSTGKTRYIEGENFSNKILDHFPEGFIKTYTTKILSIAQVKKALNSFKPDIVYIRQNIWYPGLTNVLKRYTTVLEINSVDYLEMEFYIPLKKKTYLFGKEKILAAAKGLVAVSPDILDHYKQWDLPMTVVSNGIDLSKFKTAPAPEANVQPSLIFVGSKNMYWHGLGKIVELAQKFPQYTFKIVGYDKKDVDQNLPDNMQFYGWLNSAELDRLYDESNIGIGSFGNHIIGKNTDSTLKVLEYLAKGLPVILGHWDVDFAKSDFVFKITDSDNKFISTEKIEAFIEANKRRRITKDEIEIIDSKNKERQRLDFFQSILNKG